MSHAEAASAEIYTPEYYRRIEALESTHWWHLGMQDIALALLSGEGRRPFRRVLDAGCGAGGMMAWAERSFAAQDVRGVDIAPEAINVCKAKNPHWQVSLGSVTDLPFPDASFDLVISNDVIQHLPTDGGDARGVREMARVLAPGGVLLLRTNSRLGMWQKHDARDADYQRYVRAEVAALVQDAGLNLDRISYANVVGGAHESLRRLLRGRRPHSHGHGSHGRAVYEGLQISEASPKRPMVNRILRAALDLEARFLQRRGRSLPFGHSIVAIAEKTST